MSYQPYDRNPSGIVFFGTAATDQVYESNANFTIDGTSLRATNIKISDGGNIGSVSDTDAISIAAGGNVTMSQNLTVTGDLTVNGTTTTIATTNSVVSDSLIELNNGASSNSNDCGLVIERGSTGDNAIFAWDESADKFTLGTTTATGASTGNLSITTGTLVANVEGNVTGDVTGNADTATTLATARNFSITGEVTASAVSFDGSAVVALDASLDATAITGQTAETAIADDDLILIYDTSNTALRKMTKANFVSGLSGGGGDITGVTAGNGLTGGGESGAVTVNVVGGDGITANADEIEVTVDGSTIELSASDGTGSVRVKDGGITNAKMADDAIDSAEIVDGAVDEVHRNRTVASPTTTHTIATDIVLCNGGGSAFTATLPAAASGKIVMIKNVGTDAITIAGNGGDTIDGAANYILYHRYETVTVVSNGSNWFII